MGGFSGRGGRAAGDGAGRAPAPGHRIAAPAASRSAGSCSPWRSSFALNESRKRNRRASAQGGAEETRVRGV